MNFKIIFTVILSLLIFDTSAQEGSSNEEAPQNFVAVEKMPEFPGGINALRKHLEKEVTYPKLARKNGIAGTVYVRFIVNTKGEVESPMIARGVAEILDKEVLRVVSNLPDFSPGMVGGKPVAVWYSIPIVFKLD